MGHPIFWGWFKEDNSNCKNNSPAICGRRAVVCVKLLLTLEL
jgi:hypothetical protein